MGPLDDLTPQDLEDAAHVPVSKAAFAFVHTVWADYDLRAAWLLTDPLLRRCWTQAWLKDQLDLARSLGHDPDEVVEAFTADRPRHRLWSYFEATQLELLAESAPADVVQWGVTARHILIGPDIELLYLLPLPAEGDTVAEGAPSMPLLMRFEDGPGWRVLNLVSERVPVPGWPPTLR